MDYSKLVEAIDQNDHATTNSLLKTLTPRLIRFLQIHMNAEKQDAEDCVQQTIMKVLHIIREGKLRDSDRILPFTLTICKNTYLNMVKDNHTSSYHELYVPHSNRPLQLQGLIDEERQAILEWCLQQLPDHYREFIGYWFRHPDSKAQAAANHFDMSVSHVWTRKHRILQKLSECCQKKSNI